MNRAFQRLLFALALPLLAACDAFAPSGPVVYQSLPSTCPVGVRVAPVVGELFPFGQVINTRFTLTNLSDKAIVVTRLDDLALSSSVYGGITYDADADRWIHHEMQQRASEQALHQAFLLPGESMELVKPWRPGDREAAVRVTYLQAAKPYDHTPASLAPLRVYVHETTIAGGMQSSYVSFTEARWTAARAGSTDKNNPRPPVRTVIIPGTETAAAIGPVPVVIPVDFDKPGFETQHARSAVKRLTGGDWPVAYSGALRGYVVYEAGKRWLLHSMAQAGRGEAVPDFPPELLFDLDFRTNIRVQISKDHPATLPADPRQRLSGETFWQLFPIEWGDGMYTRGQFIEVEIPDFKLFLDHTLKNNLRLTRHNYFFDEHYYVLEKLPG